MNMNGMQDYQNDENILEKFGRNITDEVKKNKVDPVIGRDEEIRKIITVLARKTKNNVILLGEPGVGKTAIIEGLAQRIVSNDVPLTLKDKEIFELDMGSLIAGAKYQGEFEERLKAVLNKIKESNHKIIMFIDEIHLIVGAGRTQGAMDASNMLKPMLARGEIDCIGATTLNEYREYIEKDRALERRFQPVMIGEPTKEDTLSILRGLKDRFESHHGVKITDNALVAAVNYSVRYITNRFLPDKAIDLIDEACAETRVEIESMPSELDDVNRKIRQLEIEKLALEQEKDEQSKVRLDKLKDELSNLEKESEKLTAKWQKEKIDIENAKSYKNKLESLNFELNQAYNRGDFKRASEIQYKEIPNVKNQLEIIENSSKDVKKLLSDEITEENIASIVSKMTNIPVSRIIKGDKERVLNLNNVLTRRVIGQDQAINLVSDAILRQRAGIKDQNRPIGSFLFLGPTGVGKTEVAKALAEALFDSETHIIRIDMSEYMEKFSTSRLVGAPPGYVGYDEGGELTDKVRENPYSVVLLDEIEKAHPDVFNLMLQVLDDGYLTDSKGRKVDFTNTIIIMTSNLGATDLRDQVEVGFTQQDEDDQYKAMSRKIKERLKRTFRPEFLNRIDDILIFHSLNKDELHQIVKLLIQQIIERLKQQQITLKLTPKAIDTIAEKGYDPEYGARPLRRAIQTEIEDRLSTALLAKEIQPGSTVTIGSHYGKLEMKVK